MKDSSLTVGQIAKLYEIEAARLKAGGLGLRGEVQELINRLSSGGVGAKSDDPRVVQAFVLWNKDFGRELGYETFAKYLATVPEIPESYRLEFVDPEYQRFPHLVLVDGRLDVHMACKLAGLTEISPDRTHRSMSPARSKTGIRWMRCQYARLATPHGLVVNRRKSIPVDEIGLDAIEGISLFIQNAKVLDERNLDLVNAGYVEIGNNVCLLRDDDGDPMLSSGVDKLRSHMMPTRLVA